MKLANDWIINFCSVVPAWKLPNPSELLSTAYSLTHCQSYDESESVFQKINFSMLGAEMRSLRSRKQSVVRQRPHSPYRGRFEKNLNVSIKVVHCNEFSYRWLPNSKFLVYTAGFDQKHAWKCECKFGMSRTESVRRWIWRSGEIGLRLSELCL